MITEVRIAPVACWCPPMKAMLAKFADQPGDEPAAGFVAIETASMRPSTICDGFEWEVVAMPDDVLCVDTRSEKLSASSTGYICNHMLELD